MAYLIPSLGAARFDTRGEQRLAERLRDTLEENAWVWHNLPAGPHGRRPDFVLLHPSHGLLVLEVKDWRLERVLRADRKQVELLTDFGPKPVDNPLEQARRYLLDVVNDLCEDPQLRHPVGHPRAGHPVVPYGFGAVFANITRRQFAATDLAAVLPPAHCLFRDEFAEGTDADALRARVWSMIGRRFGMPLSLPQIDRLRARLFPEIVVRQIALPFAPPVGAEDDRRLAVLDLQQEQLARSLGGGHRVVRGVAGSGNSNSTSLG